MKGVLTTVLATPCSGSLIIPVLTWAAAQPTPIVFATFIAMGLGMGSPYLLIAFFPNLIKALPKPGAWMETFKQVMGFILLGTVAWLFNSLQNKYIVPTIALIFSLWFGCWWIGRISITASSMQKFKQYATGLGLTAALAFVTFRFFLPMEHGWETYSPQRLAELTEQGETVLVDFTADWCATCKANEKLVLSRESTQEYLNENGVRVLVADKTNDSPEIDQLLTELGNAKVAIPYYAVFHGQSPPVVFDGLLTQRFLFDKIKQAQEPSLQVSRVEPAAQPN
ncbi:MAG: thioredoxin family protein [Pirellulaceae bacterium]